MTREGDDEAPRWFLILVVALGSALVLSCFGALLWAGVVMVSHSVSGG